MINVNSCKLIIVVYMSHYLVLIILEFLPARLATLPYGLDSNVTQLLANMLSKPSVFYYLPIVPCNLVPIKLLYYYYYKSSKILSSICWCFVCWIYISFDEKLPQCYTPQFSNISSLRCGSPAHGTGSESCQNIIPLPAIRIELEVNHDKILFPARRNYLEMTCIILATTFLANHCQSN